MTASPVSPATASSRPARRRRGAELVRAIHTAALAEALDAGIDGMTMESVARRARTAKTSLYRRWSSPPEILMDALQLSFPLEQPSAAADDLRGDLLRALTELADWLRTPMAQVAARIVVAGPRHAALKQALYEQVFDARGGRVTLTALRHYAEQGVIDGARLTPAVADIGEAMVMKILTDTDRLPTRAELEAIVDQVILPAVGESSQRPHPASVSAR